MDIAWPSLIYAGPSDVMMLRSCTARFTWLEQDCTGSGQIERSHSDQQALQTT